MYVGAKNSLRKGDNLLEREHQIKVGQTPSLQQETVHEGTVSIAQRPCEGGKTGERRGAKKGAVQKAEVKHDSVDLRRAWEGLVRKRKGAKHLDREKCPNFKNQVSKPDLKSIREIHQ